jgi:hypothetical protein
MNHEQEPLSSIPSPRVTETGAFPPVRLSPDRRRMPEPIQLARYPYLTQLWQGHKLRRGLPYVCKAQRLRSARPDEEEQLTAANLPVS